MGGLAGAGLGGVGLGAAGLAGAGGAGAGGARNPPYLSRPRFLLKQQASYYRN